MAVGKSSMARASKAQSKSKTNKKPAKAVKAAVSETTAKETVETKTAVKETAVIAAPSEDVMKKVVYQKASQVLERDAKPGETFGIGDSMPIYFL